MAMTRANMNKQTSTPSNKKGFSMLPEAVQEKMSSKLAKQYSGGGAIKSKGAARGGIKIRGTGAATKGLMARGPMG